MNKEEQLIKDGITEGYTKAREEYRVQEWLEVTLAKNDRREIHFLNLAIERRAKEFQKELKLLDTLEERKLLIKEEKLRYFGKNS